MKFIELSLSRFSVRKYTEQKVEPEKIEQCLKAVQIAPSASNAQPWKFVIVDDPELKNQVARETYNSVVSFNRFASKAPIIIAIVMEKAGLITQLGGKIKHKEFSLIDIGIAAEHFCLQAAELGLGTCMLGWFNERQIQKLLSIPKSKTIGLLITLGYPDQKPPEEKRRKKIHEIFSYNSYE